MFAKTIIDWLKKYRSSSSHPGKRKTFRPRLEILEDRDCPAVFNVANGDVATLIADITLANANNQADTINLAAGGTYNLTTAIVTGTGNNGLPIVTPDTANPANTLTIEGNGATIQRTGVGTLRILQITGVLNLDQVTISNGIANDGQGGAGIDVQAGGVLHLTNSAIINNTNQNQFGGGIAFEVGAAASTISQSTISGNQTLAGNNGGGIEMLTVNTLSITQSTIANNQASVVGGGLGGGLRNPIGTGTVTILNSIIATNTASAGGGNDVSNFGALVTNASIIPTIVGAGTVTGAPSTVTPTLGILRNNGGLTPTQALLAGSPSGIDQGNNANAPSAFDQRGAGFNRIINGTVDIGAYEFQPLAVTVGISSSLNPSKVGQTVVFTAAVQGVALNSNIPQGTVTFLIDGSVAATLALINGSVSFSVPSLTAGNHSIQAVYSPTLFSDYGFSAGSSAVLTQRVQPPTPVVTTPVVTPPPPVVTPPPTTRRIFGRRYNR